MALLRCSRFRSARGARAATPPRTAGVPPWVGPMLRAHHRLRIRTPSAVRTWVTDFDGDNLRGGSMNEGEL